MDSWIAQMCRSRARRQTLGWVVVFLAGAALVLSSGRYVRNFFEGPFALQPTELAQITDLETTPNYFISVAGEKKNYTEIQKITTTPKKGVKEGSHPLAGYFQIFRWELVPVVSRREKPPK